MFSIRNLVVLSAAVVSLGACATSDGAPPQSKSELQDLLRSDDNSPLQRLSASDREDFISSIQVGPQGVAGLKLSPLSRLTNLEQRQVLDTLGLPLIPSTANQISPHTVLEGYLCNQFVGACQSTEGWACVPETCHAN
jgi:hypothetical protein